MDFCRHLVILFFTFIKNGVCGFPFIPTQWLPWRQIGPIGGPFGVCGPPQVYNVVLLLRLTPLDIAEAKDAMTFWTFGQLSKLLHERASQVDGESLYNLFIVERYLPSEEFIEAVEGLTAVQKAHIGELSISGRRIEMDQIMSGIILSLPNEVQIKARNFMLLMKTLVCLHSSLQGPPMY